MVTLTLNGERHVVHHIPVTLRNVHKAQAALERINSVVQADRTTAQLSGIRSALRVLPELSMYVDANGNYRADMIASRVENARRMHAQATEGVEDAEPFDETAAMVAAQEFVRDRVQAMIVSNPDVIQLLQFTTDAYPTDIEALSEGVAIIKETVDRTKTHADTLALIDKPIEDDVWQDVDAAEVAAYCDTFRNAFQRRAVPSVAAQPVADSNDATQG